MIESLVALLLLLTIGYCVLLNNRLKSLKADEHSLKVTIAELITATEMAERAVAGFKATALECEATLGERLRVAERFGAELGRHVKAGEIIINRLTRVAVAARPVLESAPASPANDPKVLAAAARSFADRLRERVSALAA